MEPQASRNSPVTRPSLLVRIRDLENHRAWEEFVEIYTPLVYGYCRKRGLQDADAADVSQEVMRAMALAIRRFEYDPQRGRFRGWLFTVVPLGFGARSRAARCRNSSSMVTRCIGPCSIRRDNAWQQGPGTRQPAFGLPYEIETSPSVNGPWTPIGQVMGTDGTSATSFFDSFVGDEAFYRVRVR